MWLDVQEIIAKIYHPANTQSTPNTSSNPTVPIVSRDQEIQEKIARNSFEGLSK